MPVSDRSLNKTERLFALVLLLQNRPNLTSQDLANHFGVSRRTVFRDLRTLAESGVPLTYAEEGGYEILEGYQLPPLMLTGREAATVLIGSEFLRLQSDLSLRADADQVAMKIRAVLPNNLREYIDKLQERTVIAPYLQDDPSPAPTENDGQWYELSEAVANRRTIWMEYFVDSRQELTKRKIEPLGLVYYSETWNVIAYDHLRKAVRNFRLDRIRRMKTLMDTFTPPEGFDLQTYLSEKSLGGSGEEITLLFRKYTYKLARKSIPSSILSIEEMEDKVRVHFKFERLEYLAPWLLGYGTDVTIEKPVRLRQMVADLAQSTVDHHG